MKKAILLLVLLSSFLISQSLTKGWYNDSFDVPDSLWVKGIQIFGSSPPGAGKVLTSDGGGVGTWQAAGAGFADPMTTRGDIIYRNPSNVTARFGLGANKFVLQSDGVDLTWSEFLASEMNIVDAGAKITATEVEGALQENRTAIDLNTAKVTNTDDQKIDVFSISGNNVQLSLESDGEATKTVDISTTTAVVANTAKVTDDDIGVAEVYDATGWNADTSSPQKNDVRDKIETMDTSIGSNTTHKTSDGSDHGFIDQSVIVGASPAFTSPFFTTDIEVRRDNILVTQSDAYGILLSNTTAATALDSIQYSPPIIWQGYGWKTDATAASQKVEFRSYVKPIEGTSAPTGDWVLESSINDGAYSNLLIVQSGGNIGVGVTSPKDGISTIGNINLGNNDASNPMVKLIFGATSSGSAEIRPIDYGGHNVGLGFFVDTNSGGITPIEKVRIDQDGKVGINTITGLSTLSINGGLHVGGDSDAGNNNLLVDGNTTTTGNTIITTQTPASAGAAGTTGTVAWDANYIYVCIATNTWKRVAIAW